MKSKLAIKRELDRLEPLRIMAAKIGDVQTWSEIVGSIQALSWALGQNAMAPTKVAELSGVGKKRKK